MVVTTFELLHGVEKEGVHHPHTPTLDLCLVDSGQPSGCCKFFKFILDKSVGLSGYLPSVGFNARQQICSSLIHLTTFTNQDPFNILVSCLDIKNELIASLSHQNGFKLLFELKFSRVVLVTSCKLFA